MGSFDTSSIRQEFEIFNNVPSLAYLDNASLTQIPNSVVSAMTAFDTTNRANVHRGMHSLTEQATDMYDSARKTVQSYINARNSFEIIFTKGCTESLNIAIKCWSTANLQKGDTVLISTLEHHSNIVPWQQMQEYLGFDIQWIDITEDGSLDMEHYKSLLQNHTVKCVSVTAQSNVLGLRPDLTAITSLAHEHDAIVIIDAAQLVAHDQVDVQKLDCDFLSFSSQKMYGPTGVGVLYGKRDLLESIPAFLGGGGMVHEVTKEGFSSTEIPHKFEAGTPPITQVIGLASAINWANDFDWQARKDHEQTLLSYAYAKLQEMEHITILGPKDSIAISGSISFVVDGVHAHDLTDMLGKKHIALRAGHHCTQPLHKALGVIASSRLSVGIYNTIEDIDNCIQEIKNICTTFRA